MVIIVQERRVKTQESVVTGYGGTAGDGRLIVILYSLPYTLLSPKVLFEVVYKSLRYPLVAPINRALLDRP